LSVSRLFLFFLIANTNNADPKGTVSLGDEIETPLSVRVREALFNVFMQVSNYIINDNSTFTFLCRSKNIENCISSFFFVLPYR